MKLWHRYGVRPTRPAGSGNICNIPVVVTCPALTLSEFEDLPRSPADSVVQRMGIKIEANANLYVVGIATY
jgi:hypothetical protein